MEQQRVEGFYRIKQLAAMLKVYPSTITRWCRINRFPQPIELGPGVKAWCADEVDEHLAALKKARPPVILIKRTK